MKTLLFVSALFISAGVQAQTAIQVLVNSRGTSAVKSYDENGNYTGDFISTGYGGLSYPEDILFHPDGRVLVTGYGNSAIKQYDGVDGTYLGEFSSGYTLDSPSKMSIGPDSLIYVTQWGSTQNKVVRFGLDGVFVDEFTSIGAPNGLGHTWDADTNFYISLYGNGGNGEVHKFDPQGNDLGTFINTTILQGPTNIWWDTNGDMLVEDWTVGKVLRYDASGQYLGEFVTGMTNPEGIAFLPDGTFLIGDWGQDAVHRVDNTGQLLGYFCAGNSLTDPNCVRVREIDVTGVAEQEQLVPKVFPTIGREFTIQLPEGTTMTDIRVINTRGELIDHPESPTKNWNANSCAPGIYFIAIATTEGTFARKVIVE